MSPKFFRVVRQWGAGQCGHPFDRAVHIHSRNKNAFTMEGRVHGEGRAKRALTVCLPWLANNAPSHGSDRDYLVPLPAVMAGLFTYFMGLATNIFCCSSDGN